LFYLEDPILMLVPRKILLGYQDEHLKQKIYPPEETHQILNWSFTYLRFNLLKTYYLNPLLLNFFFQIARLQYDSGDTIPNQPLCLFLVMICLAEIWNLVQLIDGGRIIRIYAQQKYYEQLFYLAANALHQIISVFTILVICTCLLFDFAPDTQFLHGLTLVFVVMNFVYQFANIFNSLIFLFM
jgi:hypothetical protein